eukprot:scaffold2.g7151.t1
MAAAGCTPPLSLPLRAALLEQPVVLPGEQGAQAWAAARDVLAEVAVTAATLRALQLPAGTLVSVCNSGRPALQPRLARVLVATHTGGEAGVAYLAPSLAHNLGLALHLQPLLAQGGGLASADHKGSSARGPEERVVLERYGAQAVPATGAVDRCALLPQPMSDPAYVPFATAVHVAVVRCPLEVLLHPPLGDDGSEEGAAHDQPPPPADSDQRGEAAVAALQSWLLAQTRVVSPGDVLAVPRRRSGGAAEALPNLHCPAPKAGVRQGEGEGQQQNGQADVQLERQQQQGEEPEGHGQELVYFKMVKLEVAGVEAIPAANGAGGEPAGREATGGAAAPIAAAVQVGKTAVQMVGTCASSVPVGLDAYLAPAGGGACSPGGGPLLERSDDSYDGEPAVWRQLAALLASALHPSGARLPLRLAALLHGPAGSGKRTAAAAAAAAAGCHVVSLSCHEIRTPAAAAQKHTLEALRGAFASAAQFRPALLLLRHFQVLGEDSHGAADAVIARFGATLAACIREGCERGAGGERDGGASSGAGRGERGEGLLPAPVVLVACAESADDVPAPLRRCFTHEFVMDAPAQPQRRRLLATGLARAPLAPAAPGLSPGELLEDGARHTAGLLPRELRAVAAEAAAAAAAAALPARQVLEAAAGSSPAADGGSGRTDCCAAPAAPPRVSERELAAAVEAVRARAAADVGAPKIPDVRWEDVGGLESVKAAILDTVELPLRHPELFVGGLRRRSGVLFYGPPGTGKTLLAKALATECSINFLSVKGPELINMYVGESERQIREVFARARRARPCVVFFDELDSLAPARGRGSDSGGVMDRVVSQLLAEIDGVQGGAGSNDVFIVGATNRPDLLDPALLRPGRLDRLLYVGVAADAPARLKVLRALTRRFALGPGVDLAAVAERCPGRFTGADLYALCSDAWTRALKRRIAALEAGAAPQQRGEGAAAPAPVAAPQDGAAAAAAAAAAVVVDQDDFLAAAASLTPSLSAEELERYEQIRRQHEQQQRPAGR